MGKLIERLIDKYEYSDNDIVITLNNAIEEVEKTKQEIQKKLNIRIRKALKTNTDFDIVYVDGIEFAKQIIEEKI